MSSNNRASLPSLTYVRCRVGHRDYALDIISVLGIQAATALSVDLQSSGQVGWVKALGQKQPIYDLAGRLRLKRPQFNPTQQRLIMINTQPTFGFLVESVSQATEVPAERVFGLPKFARNSEKDYFSGVVSTADGLLPLLNPLNILPLFKPTPLKQESHLYPPANMADVLARGGLAAASGPTLATFSLAEEDASSQSLRYGVSGSQILEIMEPSYITALPASPHHVIGLTQWQGIALPLIDVGALLGRKGGLSLTKQREYRFVLARDAHDQLACLCVQANIAVNPLVDNSIASSYKLPYPHPAVRGVFDIDQQTVAVLDTTQLWAV